METLNKYGYNGIARHVSLGIISAALVFIGAGTLDWAWGWVFVVIYTAGWIVLSVLVARYNPGLMNERGKRNRDMQGTARWDWVLLSIYSLLIIVQPLVGGLDFRYGWSAPFHPAAYIAGNLLIIAGFVLLTGSMIANRNFTQTVRIQDNHQVATGGPYRWVRHPGYSGLILQFVGMGLALSSWAALVVGLIGVVDYIIRTALEDSTLQRELPGYMDFTHKTRYRLLPGVW